jgi:hypothetical protein
VSPSTGARYLWNSIDKAANREADGYAKQGKDRERNGGPGIECIQREHQSRRRSKN